MGNRVMISDLDLIRTFILNSIAGKESLLANPTLQARTMGGAHQLISKKEGVIVTANIDQGKPLFWVQFDSSCCEMLSQTLLEAGFLPISDIQDKAFKQNQTRLLKYSPYKLPQDYVPHCTQAIGLWKTWWRYARRIRSQTMQLDLLIRRRNTWYPVKDIFVTEGLIYVKTLELDLTLHSEDLIFWLHKQGSELVEENQNQRPRSRAMPRRL